MEETVLYYGFMMCHVGREFCVTRIYHFICFTCSVMLVCVVLSSVQLTLCSDKRRISLT